MVYISVAAGAVAGGLGYISVAAVTAAGGGGYISIAAVTATYGSALTAGHFWKDPKVTKRSSPHHSAPRLGSVCPNEGFGAWAAVMGHPWPRTANPASCRVTRAPKPAFGQRGLTGRRRSKAKARRPSSRPVLWLVYSVKCGRGLAPDEGVSVTYLLTDPPPSGASPLPHLDLHRSEISIGQVDLVPLLLCFCSVFDLDLRRPVKPRWPNAGLNPWVTRQDAGLAVLGQGWPMTAAHGFKPAFGHTEPKRGAEWWGKSPFGYFWGSFPKVTRCKSGTLSSRYRSNGYVLGQIQPHGRPEGRHGNKPPPTLIA